MAHVGGPTRKLPGAHLPFPEGTKCDEHPDRLAYRRIQGETDSFGYEAFDMCEQCFNEYEQNNDDNKLVGTCNRCHGRDLELQHCRDPFEGSTGPVYLMCLKCQVALMTEFSND